MPVGGSGLLRVLFRSAWLVCIGASTAIAMADEPAPVGEDHARQMAAGLELFNREVSALLTQHCLECHGGKAVKSDFDLSTREGLLRGGAQGPSVTPGKSRESLLYQLITHAEEPAMPDGRDRLPDEAVARIAEWIDLGAPYARPLVERADGEGTLSRVTDEERNFWSFRPLAPVGVPAVKNSAWCRNEVDRFVLARLEAAGIGPNIGVDRRRLIRRLYFDVIGLPPTPEEIERFVNDPAGDAYERLVDQLLDSPHYGERWGRHWLDIARFAESHGFEQDYDRPAAYHYRDFVIQALNLDMPYDQFVRWQIAGDEFAPDNLLAQMATGFLGAGTHATQITASQVEKERYDELDDMGATIGTALLGLTIGCARCHDHKFDPISQRDYYRLISTFTTTVRSEQEFDFAPEETARVRREFDAAHAPLVQALAQFEADELPRRVQSWLAAGEAPRAPRWLIVAPAALTSAGGAEFQPQPDGSQLATGKNEANDVYQATFDLPAGEPVTDLRIEALADASLPKQGPGRADNGNFALSSLVVEVVGSASPVPLAAARATFEQKGLAAAGVIDHDAKTAWAVDPKFGEDHALAVSFASPIERAQGLQLRVTLHFEVNQRHSIGRVRWAIATGGQTPLPGDEAASLAAWQAVNEAWHKPESERSESDRQALVAWYRGGDADWQRLSAAVAEHARQVPQPKLTKVMVCSEGLPAIRWHTQGGDFLEKTHFLKRGDLNQKLGEATQSFPQVLMNAPEGEKHWQEAPPAGARTPYLRRALANWITDAERGAGDLLARVMVNRLWQHHFGRGIVATPSDFGSQGAAPTHPELLEMLAARLQAEGWRLKPLHRLMLTSATYRQSGEFDARKAEVDPNNTLLWRRTPQRLEGEVIRDALLAVSNQLDDRMFGPGTLDPSHRRRSIYFMIKRSQLVSMLTLFDGPDSLQGLGQRATTTIPPQALYLMNNPQVDAYVRAFATRMQAAPNRDLAGAVEHGFELALGRRPTPDERGAALEFVAQQQASYREAGSPEPELLALADLGRALVSLNEFIYVE